MEKESVEKTNPLGRGLRYRVCDICGEKVKSQGYGGHLFLQHNVKTGVVARLDEIEKRLNASDGPGVRSNSNPGTSLEEIEGRLENLEKMQVHSLPKPGHGNRGETSPEVIDDLAGKLESVLERLGDLEDFNGRVGFDEKKKVLTMSKEDWEEVSSGEEGEGEEEKEGDKLPREEGEGTISGPKPKKKKAGKENEGGGFWPWDPES